MPCLLNPLVSEFPTAAKRSGGIFGGMACPGVAPFAEERATPPDPSASMTSLGKSGNYIFGSTPDVR